MKNLIYSISGGIGKSITATAVCKAIKKKYPSDKLIVLTGYPEVFSNSKDVDMAFGFGQEAYFYSKYIENQDVLVMANEPYNVTEHILCKEHLIETWCKMFGLKYNGEKPVINLTQREIKYFQNKFASDKPIMLLQTNGGAQTDHKYSWARDLPSTTVVKVIEQFKDNYNIIHIRREDQLSYNNTTPVTDSFRALCVLLTMSSKRLLIDSFSQHAASALELPSTVCWVSNKPEVFGYDLHDNITANEFTTKPELRNAYLSKFNITGELIEFPYNSEDEIFNVETIIESLSK
jgi:hypothetical protein